MPIVNITTWPAEKETKHKLMREITKVVNDVLGAPLDKISVFLQEIEKDDWADAGVVGTDPDFSEKSRRKDYKD